MKKLVYFLMVGLAFTATQVAHGDPMKELPSVLPGESMLITTPDGNIIIVGTPVDAVQHFTPTGGDATTSLTGEERLGAPDGELKGGAPVLSGCEFFGPCGESGTYQSEIAEDKEDAGEE